MADRCDACGTTAVLVVRLSTRHPRYNRRKPETNHRCERHSTALIRLTEANPTHYEVVRDEVPTDWR